MTFEETLYMRDDEADEFGDSGAFNDTLEEDYEEEEEEEAPEPTSISKRKPQRDLRGKQQRKSRQKRRPPRRRRQRNRPGRVADAADCRNRVFWAAILGLRLFAFQGSSYRLFVI